MVGFIILVALISVDGEWSSEVSMMFPGACIDDARPLLTGVGVGLATGVSASTGSLGMMGGEASSTSITNGVANGWTRGGKDSLSNAVVGEHVPWEVVTGTSTTDLVGVILPSFACWGRVEEWDMSLAN